MERVRQSNYYKFNLFWNCVAKPAFLTELKTLLKFFDKRIIKYYFVSLVLFVLLAFLIKSLCTFQKKGNGWILQALVNSGFFLAIIKVFFKSIFKLKSDKLLHYVELFTIFFWTFYFENTFSSCHLYLPFT